ncbi:MAG: DUF4925 domain-containing protein [Prevotella sp.]|nr:DUF4925 domain-containing protein [Bacteroides sp.]MCM1366235.1 DUF4925 domain-containing protein [Prevotella sp.]MCM1436360.1 DUF4925 domain-containing protein [Prevotella sp.]
MKKVYIFAISLITFMILAGCSDDPDIFPDNSGKKIYSGDMLTVNYMGNQMLGKSITFEQNGQNASLTLFSQIGLALLPDSGIATTIDGPGIIPGDKTLVLDIDLHRKGDKYTFSGHKEATFCSFNYFGKIDSNHLTIDISDVLMKNTALQNTSWTPLPYLPGKEPVAMPLSTPLSMTWSSAADVSLPEGNLMKTQQIADILLYTPIFFDKATGENASIAELLARSLKSVSFSSPSGCEIMLNQNNGAELTLNQSDLQYVVPKDGSLLLYVNPEGIAKQILNSTRAVEISSTTMLQAIETLLYAVRQNLSDGFIFTYALSADSLQISLPSEITIPAVKAFLTKLLSDDKILETILNGLSKDPALAEYIPVFKVLAAQLPNILEQTSEMTLTLSLKPL